MSDLFYNYDYVLNSGLENENNKFEVDQYSSDIFSSDTVDVTDFEKHVISHKRNLEQRLKELQITMASLKKQVEEEKYLWKKQLEEVAQEQSEQAKSLQNFTHDSCDTIESGSKLNLTTSEYDEKVIKYEDALLKAHAEKKANLKRQIVINNYKRRLMEVENMCNMELLRVKQSVQYLQPLQVMASEWKLNSNENMINDIEIVGTREKKLSTLSQSTTSDDKLSVEYGDKHNDDIQSMIDKESCCCSKIPKISSATQVWDGDEGIGDLSTSNRWSLEYYKHASSNNSY